MAYYCVKCGRKLPDGAICPCRIRRRSRAAADDPVESGVSFRNILRINDPDFDRNADYYERGKQIVPDLVASCEDEVPIKQYHLVNIRARFQGLWAEGRLMVTNKRILFRASGRSLIGRTMVEQEYVLDEISGLEISRGVRFSPFDLVSSMVLMMCCLSLAYPLKLLGGFFGWALPLLLIAGGITGLYFLGHHKYRWKLVLSSICAAGAVTLLLRAQLGGHSFLSALFSVAVVVLTVTCLLFLIMSSMKSVVSLSVTCKAGTSEAIGMHSPQHFRLQSAPELLPTEETDTAIREVGAIINDIQRMGDYGIEKWRAAEPEEQPA